jgi:hypothetical protein
MGLPADELAELQAMVYLSDDTLWTIAREQMQPDLQKRMSTLMNKNSEGTITGEEHNELSSLVERGERLMLRKAEAMKLLLERGYPVTLADLELVPFVQKRQQPQRRIAGLNRGAMKMHDDFNDPLLDEFWLGEE